MGTRNLTCVVLNGEYKVAQYGQWDGDPGGQGMTALRFVKSLTRYPTKMGKFISAISGCKFFTDEEMNKMDDIDWKTIYPQVSSDHGAEILSMIYKSVIGLSLYNQISFAGYSLFCEWAYVLNLD